MSEICAQCRRGSARYFVAEEMRVSVTVNVGIACDIDEHRLRLLQSTIIGEPGISEAL